MISFQEFCGVLVGSSIAAGGVLALLLLLLEQISGPDSLPALLVECLLGRTRVKVMYRPRATKGDRT